MGVLILQRKIESLRSGKLVEFMEETLNELEDEIVKLNKLQLEKGEKADSSFLPNYSPRTIKLRNEQGRPVKGERISLFDYGNFWGGFWVQAYNNKLSIFSHDEKTEMLVSKYGNSIFGLTKSNFEILGDLATPILKHKVEIYLKQ